MVLFISFLSTLYKNYLYFIFKKAFHLESRYLRIQFEMRFDSQGIKRGLLLEIEEAERKTLQFHIVLVLRRLVPLKHWTNLQALPCSIAEWLNKYIHAI